MNTMFMITALAYVLIAGEPADGPYGFNSKISFTSLEQCQEHLKSPDFAIQKELLSRTLAATAAISLEAVPGIAITASCVPDNRL